MSLADGPGADLYGPFREFININPGTEQSEIPNEFRGPDTCDMKSGTTASCLCVQLILNFIPPHSEPNFTVAIDPPVGEDKDTIVRAIARQIKQVAAAAARFGHKVKKIARELDLPPSTVSRLFRAAGDSHSVPQAVA